MNQDHQGQQREEGQTMQHQLQQENTGIRHSLYIRTVSSWHQAPFVRRLPRRISFNLFGESNMQHTFDLCPDWPRIKQGILWVHLLCPTNITKRTNLMMSVLTQI